MNSTRPSVVDEGESDESDGSRKMALSRTRRAEQQKIGALFEPTVAGGERHHLCFADHGNGLELEAVECFADGQPSFDQVTLDAPASAIGHLVLGKGG
jgi:hypothetical protein